MQKHSNAHSLSILFFFGTDGFSSVVVSFYTFYTRSSCCIDFYIFINHSLTHSLSFFFSLMLKFFVFMLLLHSLYLFLWLLMANIVYPSMTKRFQTTLEFLISTRLAFFNVIIFSHRLTFNSDASTSHNGGPHRVLSRNQVQRAKFAYLLKK